MTAPHTTAGQGPLIALCAGEASGDLLGAHLMAAIKQRCPNARFIGIGGPRMLAEGIESLYEQEKLAVRGFAEVVKRLPEILRIRRGLVRELKRIRPDVFVGIDAPDFNLGVAEKLKKAGIATLHYVSPSVWAWRRERVNTIVHQVNKCCACFRWKRRFTAKRVDRPNLSATRWRKRCRWMPIRKPRG